MTNAISRPSGTRQTPAKDPVRYERNLITNLGKICELVDGGGSSRLAMSLFMFICDTYQKNIFNFGILDPDQFARDYGFSPSFLRSACPQPYQYRNMTRADLDAFLSDPENSQARRPAGEKKEFNSRLWDSNLENGLYVFQNRPLNIVAGGSFSSRDGMKTSVSIQIIKSLRAVYNGKKVVYQFTINPDIQRNLCRYFLTADRNSLVRLMQKRSQRESLYIYLCNLKQAMEAQGVSETQETSEEFFEKLCEVADIPTVKANGQKIETKYVRRNLAAAIREVSEETDLLVNLSWRKIPGNASANLPILTFANSIFSQGLRRVENDTMRDDILFREIIHQCVDKYRQRTGRWVFGPEDKDAFLSWFCSGADINMKKLALENSVLNAFGSLPGEIERICAAFSEKLPTLLQKDFEEHIRRTATAVRNSF